MTMTREEADQALATVVSEYERIAVAMYGIDSHSGLAFLKSSVLSGRTSVEWQDVRTRIDVLWAQFGALRTLIEAARAVRGQRSRPDEEELAELARLLTGPAVELDATGMPLDPASAAPPSGAGASQRLGLVQLAQRMQAQCAETAAWLTDVDNANTAITAALAPIADAVAQLRRLTTELGADQAVAAAAEAELERLGALALGDPLAWAGSSVESGLRQLAADVTSARAGLAEVARARDDMPGRLRRLRQAVDELADAEAQAARSYGVVAVKIAHPGLPPAPAAAAGLRARLADLERASGPWVRRVAELTTLEGDVAAAARRGAQLRAAADGLLDRRAELRGRLDAYRAKAARLGYAEHPELSTLHREAKQVLYTSPCDLAAATRMVAGYQRALAELAGEPR